MNGNTPASRTLLIENSINERFDMSKVQARALEDETNATLGNTTRTAKRIAYADIIYIGTNADSDRLRLREAYDIVVVTVGRAIGSWVGINVIAEGLDDTFTIQIVPSCAA